MPTNFFDELDDSAAMRLRDAAAMRSYPRGSYVFHEGDASSAVVIVMTGLLRIDRVSLGGRVVLLDLATAGDVIGELGVIDDEPRSAAASAVTACQVLHVPAVRFRELMTAEPTIQAAVMRRLTRRLRALSTQFLETSAMGAPSRIAARLVRLVSIEQERGGASPGLGGVIDLRLPINQAELAQWSGLAREGAVKGIAALREEGIIESGRMRIRILDMEALKARAAAF